MDNHLLPTRLYKLIPIIYIGLGVYIWFKLDTVYALISGTMLVGAGGLVLLMRQSAAYDESRQRIKEQQTKKYEVDEGYEDTLTLTLQ